MTNYKEEGWGESCVTIEYRKSVYARASKTQSLKFLSTVPFDIIEVRLELISFPPLNLKLAIYVIRIWFFKYSRPISPTLQKVDS